MAVINDQKHKPPGIMWIIVYAGLLLSFTVYILLDTFVIKRVYAEVGAGQVETVAGAAEEAGSTLVGVGTPSAFDETEAETDEASEPVAPVVTDTLYSDANINITLSEYREYDSAIYVADVQVASPEYLKSAFAQGLFGKNVTAATSEMAEENGSILAINGDYYGSQEKGYVIRNGVLYRAESAGREDLVIYSDGSFGIINENDISAEQLIADGAWQVMSFGPALIEDGLVAVDEDDEVGKAMASNPRTAIAVIDNLHYLFIVSDGRTGDSEGLSLYELAQFIRSLGAETAYNLDGGGSSTMYFNGEVINNPTSSGRSISERNVSDILYIGY